MMKITEVIEILLKAKDAGIEEVEDLQGILKQIDKSKLNP